MPELGEFKFLIAIFGLSIFLGFLLELSERSAIEKLSEFSLILSILYYISGLSDTRSLEIPLSSNLLKLFKFISEFANLGFGFFDAWRVFSFLSLELELLA